MFSGDELARVVAGDLDVLVDLDRRGFIVGGDETAEQYGERLARLKTNIESMEQELVDTGRYHLDDVDVDADARIPAELFADPAEETRELFDFAVDWVPGFFINPSFSWLFGGCAYYVYPEFFALFIIRKSFADREKWLIYDRNELLAHELCHVARIGMDSLFFEEHFAYMTARSGFRKAAGAVFRSPADSFALLGSTMLLLCAQLLHVIVFPSMVMWPFWCAVAGVIAFLCLRHSRDCRTLRTAIGNLESFCPGHGRAIAFRCTDDELFELAQMSGGDAVGEFVAACVGESLRWQVIRARFLEPRTEGTQSDDDLPCER